MIGQTISHYTILEKLGEGGMGVVYKALDARLDRAVALKFLPHHLASNIKDKHRFIHEAKAASALDHPNICTVYDIDETPDGQLFIVMAYYEGQILQEMVRPEETARVSPLSIDNTLSYVVQVAKGLSAAHRKGIIHRDIKSSNIMITSDDRAVIMDFGLAKHMSGQTLTKTGGTVGTVPYMSPEQARGEDVDHRSDIWSLGIVLYEMVTGRVPFASEYSDAVVYAILNEDPKPLASLRADSSAALESVVRKMLAKNPDDRYQGMDEVLLDLEALHHPTAGLRLPRAAQRFFVRQRRRVLVGAAVLPAVIASIIAAFLWLSPTHSITAIAVLPLENLSNDREQDPLVAGMHEALITDLAKLSGLHRVIARSSVMRYSGSNKTLAEFAAELGVDAVITGSVLRSGERVQVTAHLIQTAGEERLWSERYERPLGDVLSLQNEIVSAIAQAVKLQLTPQEQERLQSRPQINPEAYEAYLQGRFQWHKQTPESYDMAEKYYQFALEKEPAYALAYAGLGMVWLMRADAGFRAPAEVFPKAQEYIAKALELDPGIAELHVHIAGCKVAIESDWTGAEREFLKAIELNPNLADARFFYADFLLSRGRPDEWEPQIKRALELDPLNEFNRSFYGWHLNYVRRYDEAIPIFRSLLATGPNKASNYLGLWGAYYRKQLYDEALTAARGYFLTIGDSAFAESLGAGGGETAYRTGMRRTGKLMAAESHRRHVPAVRIARMFAHAGDKDEAFFWLEKAYEAHESPMKRIGVFWDWDDLRAEPRFKDLLRRLKLPDQQISDIQ